MLSPELHKKTEKIAETIFGTHQDLDQIEISSHTRDKLETLTKNWIRCQTDEKGDPISWVVVIPTTKALAERFLAGEITEREMLHLTMPQDMYSALYLCSAITVPEYRRQGLATRLMSETIKAIPTTPDCILFTWVYSKEGGALVSQINKLFNNQIRIKK